MRFSAILMSAGFIALAAAQSSVTTSSAAPNPTAICLANCTEGDVTCQAACVGVPAPDASMVNATNDCAAACPQGNGTAAETETYSRCVQLCISNEFLISSTATSATATGTAATGSATGSATGTGSSASASGTSGTAASGSGSSTGTETANASATADSAAAGYTVTGSFMALFAVAAGIIVL